jgi:uncharacterized protein YcbX
LNYKLTEINIYPVKSLGGISLPHSFVEEQGLKYDRRWMLVYENGTFFTQRDHPQMAMLQTEIKNDVLHIFHSQSKTHELVIPPVPDGSSELEVTVWDDKCTARTYSKKIDDWFTEVLGFNCRLVFMSEDIRRELNTEYARNKSVSFADAYPFLIIGKESLKDLNNKMKKELPMSRFRTNFVFGGGEPFDEDQWQKIRIGKIDFDVVKPCARCVITTVNNNTGKKEKEPLATLAKFRKVNGKVLFGQNMVTDGRGKIEVGSQIEVLNWKEH